MGMMTGSGECWSGECDHSEHLGDFEKIDQLKYLVLAAKAADPSQFTMGKLWHKEAEALLEIL